MNLQKIDRLVEELMTAVEVVSIERAMLIAKQSKGSLSNEELKKLEVIDDQLSKILNGWVRPQL